MTTEINREKECICVFCRIRELLTSWHCWRPLTVDVTCTADLAVQLSTLLDKMEAMHKQGLPKRHKRYRKIKDEIAELRSALGKAKKAATPSTSTSSSGEEPRRSPRKAMNGKEVFLSKVRGMSIASLSLSASLAHVKFGLRAPLGYGSVRVPNKNATTVKVLVCAWVSLLVVGYKQAKDVFFRF